MIRFVSLRRCELKCAIQYQLRPVPTCSSPCGDVNWNILPRLRPGRQPPFVSPRRRELKFLSTWGGNGILCSSPCGDVSWNDTPYSSAILLYGSSPCGDVNWNRASSCACMSRNTIRLLVGMWVEVYCSAADNHHTGCSFPYGDVSWNIATGAFLYESS